MALDRCRLSYERVRHQPYDRSFRDRGSGLLAKMLGSQGSTLKWNLGEIARRGGQ